MQKYETPEAEVILFEADDVITTSPGGIDTENDNIGISGSMFNLF